MDGYNFIPSTFNKLVSSCMLKQLTMSSLSSSTIQYLFNIMLYLITILRWEIYSPYKGMVFTDFTLHRMVISAILYCDRYQGNTHHHDGNILCFLWYHRFVCCCNIIIIIFYCVFAERNENDMSVELIKKISYQHIKSNNELWWGPSLCFFFFFFLGL